MVIYKAKDYQDMSRKAANIISAQFGFIIICAEMMFAALRLIS